MRKRLHHVAILVMCLMALEGCGFKAPAPKLTPPPAARPLPHSTISTTLTVPISTIVAAIDSKTRTQIARLRRQPVHCAIAKCVLDLTAIRTGPIEGATRDGRLELMLPFRVDAHLSFNAHIFKTGADAHATGEAIADTEIGLRPDWKLQTNTQGVVHLHDSRVRLGPISLDLTDLWNENDEKLSQPLFRNFDRRIASSINLKQQAQRLWSRVQRPIRIGKSPESWLMLEPERLRISTISAEEDTLQVGLAAETRAHIVVGPEPSLPPSIAPLPRPLPLSSASNRFSVAVPAELPFMSAAALAMERLHKHPIHVGSTKVEFRDLRILPSGDDIVLLTRFCVAQGWDFLGWFDSCGVGYLRGRPEFDAARQQIRIAHVRYDIATEGLIASAMQSLAGDSLGRALESHLIFDVSHELSKLHNQLGKLLSKPPARGVQLIGTIGNFGNPTLTWTKTAFVATFSATGTIEANLNIQAANTSQ